MIKISIIQLKPKIGDLEANSKKILDFYLKAQGEIVLFPELSLLGYLPKDLLLYPKFISECHAKLNHILQFIKEKICIIGLPSLQKPIYQTTAFLMKKDTSLKAPPQFLNIVV
jgi:NAD+ synthase (glutamine-hydrolysing)